MGIQVKICGITQPVQAEAIARLGAYALGFICAPASPRYVTPAQIRACTEALPNHPVTGDPTQTVGVFVNADIERIAETVEIGRLTTVQLHGEESREFCQQVRSRLPHIKLLKAFRVKTTAVLEVTYAYTAVVDGLLLDAYHPDQHGGTGKTLDWQALQRFSPDCPWWLAGGLTPDNVVQALGQLHPNGIDLSSGVEVAPGYKDLSRVAQLFAQLQVLETVVGSKMA
jgi:phosphoribosylanthranilate isomerase